LVEVAGSKNGQEFLGCGVEAESKDQWLCHILGM
jgi:hypothetical protein